MLKVAIGTEQIPHDVTSREVYHRCIIDPPSHVYSILLHKFFRYDFFPIFHPFSQIPCSPDYSTPPYMLPPMCPLHPDRSSTLAGIWKRKKTVKSRVTEIGLIYFRPLYYCFTINQAQTSTISSTPIQLTFTWFNLIMVGQVSDKY